jgi:hypothetical protein
MPPVTAATRSSGQLKKRSNYRSIYFLKKNRPVSFRTTAGEGDEGWGAWGDGCFRDARRHAHACSASCNIPSLRVLRFAVPRGGQRRAMLLLPPRQRRTMLAAPC